MGIKGWMDGRVKKKDGRMDIKEVWMDGYIRMDGWTGAERNRKRVNIKSNERLTWRIYNRKALSLFYLIKICPL